MGNVVGWRDASRYSKYPLSEASSLVSTSGWWLPSTVFVDAQLRLDFGTTSAGIGSLSLSGGEFTGTIVSGPNPIGSFTFSPETLNGGVASIISPLGLICGFLVTGEHAQQDLAGMPGEVDFDLGTAEFETATIFVYPQQVVRAIQTEDSVVTGRVVMVEGPGVALVKEGLCVVRIDAVGTAASVTDCARAQDLGPALKTINGADPDTYGNFLIEPDSYATPASSSDDRQILTVTAGVNSLKFALAR